MTEASRRHGRVFWTVVGLSVMAVLNLGGVSVALANDATARHVREEQAAVNDLQPAMFRQEVAIDKYVHSGDPAVFAPYVVSRDDTDQALVQLRQLAAGTARAEQTSRVETAARDWQSWAEDVRARAPAAAGQVEDGALVEQGQRLFDAFTNEQDRLTSRQETDLAAASAMATAATVGTAFFMVAEAITGVALLVITQGVRRYAIDPLAHLAESAALIADGTPVTIPHTERPDEVGKLARALQDWQDTSAAQEILTEQAPVGICRVDPEGRLSQVNVAMATMLGYDKWELVNRPFPSIVHPDERRFSMSNFAGVLQGTSRVFVAERRGLRKDGTAMWCSLRISAVRTPEGQFGGLIVILEDISERKRQAERATHVQRKLLPQAVPVIEGYDLAGICLPAQDVAGDFYDWVLQQGGLLDVTVADVMGKGMGAALLMATVRASLRAAARELGPAARVRQAADSLDLGLFEEGLFVTLFHARLDVASGALRYVDAGHGHCAIRRPDGEFVRLPAGSLPLGVLPDDPFEEGLATLEPGDTLIVYSDGLVETEERTIGLSAFAAELYGSADAAEAVTRMAARMPNPLADDVTIVLLRRLADVSTEAGE